jgi:hypothetical protein
MHNAVPEIYEIQPLNVVEDTNETHYVITADDIILSCSTTYNKAPVSPVISRVFYFHTIHPD